MWFVNQLENNWKLLSRILEVQGCNFCLQGLLTEDYLSWHLEAKDFCTGTHWFGDSHQCESEDFEPGVREAETWNTVFWVYMHPVHGPNKINSVYVCEKRTEVRGLSLGHPKIWRHRRQSGIIYSSRRSNMWGKLLSQIKSGVLREVRNLSNM